MEVKSNLESFLKELYEYNSIYYISCYYIDVI